MAHYVRGSQAFRRASMPPEETRTWLRAGLAGGITPWWHHVGADQEDLRQFETSRSLFSWHAEHEGLLYNRTPISSVGLVWSNENIDFFGRDNVAERCELPWRGWTAALTRARIPFVPLHASSLPVEPAAIRTLILPQMIALSNEQCESLLRFAEAGGNLILTGTAGGMDETGARREPWPFVRLFGYAPTGLTMGAGSNPSTSWEIHSGHTYVRFGDAAGARHEAVSGFDRTRIIAFGGTLDEFEPIARLLPVRADAPLDWVPPFPIYPPEFAWMRTPVSDVPALLVRTLPGSGRVALWTADIDRQHGRLRLPDHADLLARTVGWANGAMPFEITGPGYHSCHLYRCDDRLVLHIVNLTGANQSPGYVEEIVPVGPLRVVVAAQTAGPTTEARSLVTDRRFDIRTSRSGVEFEIDRVGGHEVIVLS